MKTTDFSALGLSTRVAVTAWNTLLRRVRDSHELSKYKLAQKVSFKMQPAQITKYEAGAQVPSIERFVSLIEASGGVVIVRRGCIEYQVTATPDTEPS
jgi:ribosome-binding protein aMBF1 (putative translation factor)